MPNMKSLSLNYGSNIMAKIKVFLPQSLGLCNIIGLPIYCNILVSNTYCNTFFRIAIYCVLSL